MSNKSIAKNSLYNMIYRGFSVLFPVITMAYISRVLLADGVGKVEYVKTIVTYFVTIASLGIPNYGIKTIAQVGDNKSQKSKSFWEMFYINGISTIIVIVIYYAFISLNPYFSDRKALFYIMGLMLVLNIINIDWYYQGVEEFKYITLRSIAVKILSFVLMLIFVKSKDDYLIYALILCIATGGNNIFNIIHLRNQINYVGIKECNIYIHLKPIFLLLGATLATEVYTLLDTIILEYLRGEIYVGYYQNCIKIVRLIYGMSIAMVATFYPRVSYFIKKGMVNESNSLLSRGFKILLLVSTPCSIGILLVSDTLVPILLGESFYPSIGSLQILSVLIIVFSFAYLLGHIILMSTGNEKRILIATICGAGINATLNFILIPTYAHYGAAFASVIAEVLVTTILISKAKSYFTLNVNFKFVFSVVMALISMTVPLLLIKFINLPCIIELIVSMVLGALVYIIVLFALRNEVAIEIWLYIKNKSNRSTRKLH